VIHLNKEPTGEWAMELHPRLLVIMKVRLEDGRDSVMEKWGPRG
jgi:hypothetical protein